MTQKEILNSKDKDIEILNYNGKKIAKRKSLLKLSNEYYDAKEILEKRLNKENLEVENALIIRLLEEKYGKLSLLNNFSNIFSSENKELFYVLFDNFHFGKPIKIYNLNFDLLILKKINIKSRTYRFYEVKSDILKKFEKEKEVYLIEKNALNDNLIKDISTEITLYLYL